MIRPHDINGLTNVNIELKLLQIDLDEKYQELISTVWLEMVIFFLLTIIQILSLYFKYSHGVMKDNTIYERNIINNRLK